MARRIYEKPSAGNKLSLPIKQHVFPKAGISRFANANGTVCLFDKVRSKTRPALPDDHTFCAMRAWDYRAEVRYMLPIENEFQELASKVIEGTLTQIADDNKRRVDEFFALWKVRAEFRSKDMTAIQANGLTGENLSEHQEEEFEKAGVLFAREGGVFPAHRLHGIQIQVAIDRHEMPKLAQVKWGIVRAQAGQFLVPDYPMGTFVPIDPTLCLIGSNEETIQCTISKNNVIKFNQQFRECSELYYFAKDLRECFD